MINTERYAIHCVGLYNIACGHAGETYTITQLASDTPLSCRERELSPMVRNETADVKVTLTAPIDTTLESPVSSKNTTLGSPATGVCSPYRALAISNGETL